MHTVNDGLRFHAEILWHDSQLESFSFLHSSATATATTTTTAKIWLWDYSQFNQLSYFVFQSGNAFTLCFHAMIVFEFGLHVRPFILSALQVRVNVSDMLVSKTKQFLETLYLFNVGVCMRSANMSHAFVTNYSQKESKVFHRTKRDNARGIESEHRKKQNQTEKSCFYKKTHCIKKEMKKKLKANKKKVYELQNSLCFYWEISCIPIR